MTVVLVRKENLNTDVKGRQCEDMGKIWHQHLQAKERGLRRDRAFLELVSRPMRK